MSGSSPAVLQVYWGDERGYCRLEISCKALGKINNSTNDGTNSVGEKEVENEEDNEENFDVNDIEEKSEDKDEIDDEFGDPTYKPGSDMLEFDFDRINETLDSDNDSIIALGRGERQASHSRKLENASPKNTTTVVQSAQNWVDCLSKMQTMSWVDIVKRERRSSTAYELKESRMEMWSTHILILVFRPLFYVQWLKLLLHILR